MNYALIIAIIISFPCALLSVFLVLKDWALIGDAMNHAMFPGIVLCLDYRYAAGNWCIYCRTVLCNCNRLSER
ncbi:TPA: hypothetical protein HNO39_18095 [Escherichia coli]|nr:hypothetical protein [Escherichia coli]